MGVATFGRAKAAVVRENAKETGAVPAPEKTTSTEVAIVDDGVGVPARAGGLTSVRGLEGDWSSRDAAIPVLKVGQKSSKEIEEHPEWLGKFIYDGSESLGDALTVIVTRMRKYYIEDTEFGSGVLPQRYGSMDEVRAAGQVGNVVDAVDMDVLIASATPEQYERYTFTDASDNGFFPARITVRSGNLSSFTGVVVRDLAGWLKGSMETGFYAVKLVKKANAKGSWYAITAKAAGKVPADLVTQIQLAYGGDVEE